jgi:RHS repeat-associated protein
MFPQYHFTGKERDTESGLDYFGARYYASSMGRFMSPDPSQLAYADPTNPQSLNLYSYALNNPVINTDPSGLACVYIDVSGNVSVSNFGTDSLWESGCSSNGGNYVDGYTDPGSIQSVFGPGGGFSYGDGTTAFIYGSSNQAFFGGQVYSGWVGNSSEFSDPDGGYTSVLSRPAPSPSNLSAIFETAQNYANAASQITLKDEVGMFNSCFLGVGMTTISDDLNPISPEGAFGAAGMSQSALSSMSTASAEAAATHSIERGLTVPLRSSIVRSGFSGAEAFTKASGWLALGSLYASIGHAYYNEWESPQCH